MLNFLNSFQLLAHPFIWFFNYTFELDKVKGLQKCNINSLLFEVSLHPFNKHNSPAKTVQMNFKELKLRTVYRLRE